MTPIRFLPEAKQELQAAADYYDSEQTGLGSALLGDVRRACRRIADQPTACRIERSDVSVRSLARFPYRIYYRAQPEEILVIAVCHRRRRPGFWVVRT
ncbi:MAG: type II toxin-antitoxin system RelE/ParE family toxin [Gammaproteobacteria bacterium]|nr:type II toxin-antitoxin system RelE/ParE family toxin [Gammaproteobacteria bacterium]